MEPVMAAPDAAPELGNDGEAGAPQPVQSAPSDLLRGDSPDCEEARLATTLRTAKRSAPSTSCARSRRRGAALPRRPRAHGPETSVLVPVSPDSNPKGGRCMTVFVAPASGEAQRQQRSTRTPKRQRVDPRVPICIWPQYAVNGMDGRFAIVSPNEQWVATMLRTMRCRKVSENSLASWPEGGRKLRLANDYSRSLAKALWSAIRVMTRKGLQNTKTALANSASGEGEPAEESSDDDASSSRVGRARTSSGYRLSHVFLMATRIAGHRVSIVNYGKQLIVKLDDNGFQFINDVVVGLIQRLSDGNGESAAKEHSTGEAGFRFDDSTPNVRGKVVWDPDQNAWRVTPTLRGACAVRYTDAKGETLGVPDTLSPGDFLAAKTSAYGRALAAWNDLDNSSRQRITLPVKIELPSSDASNSVDGSPQETGEEPLEGPTNAGQIPLADKWGHDSDMPAL